MTVNCPECNEPIEQQGDKLVLNCPKCSREVKVRMYVPQSTQKLEGTPLKGNVRLAWFGLIGISLLIEIVWFAVNGGGDASAFAATILLSLCGIIFPIYFGQRKTRTFEAAVHKGAEWMGWLAWLGLISVALLQFSIPLLFVMLGIIAIGIPFLALSGWFAFKNRRKQSRVPEVGNHTTQTQPLRTAKTQQ